MCEKEKLPVEKNIVDESVLEMTSKKKLSEQEERDYARSFVEILQSNEQFAESRSSGLHDEFTRLEVQISVILLAFAGIFLDFFEAEKLKDIAIYLVILMKIIYISTVFFLILSLALGLIHIMRKQKFWNELVNKRIILLINWNKFLKKESSFEKTLSFHEGATSGSGVMVSSPKWTWVLQTVFLGIAVALFFLLFLVILFN